MIDIEAWAKAHPHHAECWSCGWETLDLEAYPTAPRPYDISEENKGKWLCDLCASTLTGSALDYPTHYDAPTLRTICYVGNAILATLRSKDSEVTR